MKKVVIVPSSWTEPGENSGLFFTEMRGFYGAENLHQDSYRSSRVFRRNVLVYHRSDIDDRRRRRRSESL